MVTLIDTATTLLQSIISALVQMLSCAWVQACFALIVVAFVISIFKRLTT